MTRSIHSTNGTLPDALYSAAQVREIDRIAIEERGIRGFDLMNRAGAAVFGQIRSRWPDLHTLLVYCGAGNNGGDGYIVARLALEAGYRVTLVSLVNAERLRGDALIARRRFQECGKRIETFAKPKISEPCVIVDALLGTGLDPSRPVTGEFATTIAAINESGNPVISVDVPSGLHADSGQVLGCAVKADCTVTFIGLKQGLFTGESAEFCGDIVFDDLEVPGDIAENTPPFAYLLQKSRLRPRSRCAHKGHFGHVLVIGGDSGFGGAARLAAEAALRSGAGLVSVATRAAHSACLCSGRPEIMCHGVESGAGLRSLLVRASVIVIGPGLGKSGWAQELFSEVAGSEIVCVVDADALNLLSDMPRRRENWVITPHPGEAARLLQSSTMQIEADRFAAVNELQRRYAGVALLKGSGTLIRDGDRIYVATGGNPGMASGGMGDVLSGVVGALIAQGLDLSAATRLAVQVHGEAADRAVKENGERGLLAADLFPHIRKLLN